MHFPPPDVVHVDPFLVVGLTVRTDNAMESDPEQSKIADLWGSAVSGGLGDLIEPGHPTRMFGVYHSYASDHLGPYSLTAGLEPIARDQKTPDGIDQVQIRGGTYLRWRSQTPVPPERSGMVIPAMWSAALEHLHQADRPHRAFQTDFERFEVDGRVELLIGIRSD